MTETHTLTCHNTKTLEDTKTYRDEVWSVGIRILQILRTHERDRVDGRRSDHSAEGCSDVKPFVVAGLSHEIDPAVKKYPGGPGAL